MAKKKNNQVDPIKKDIDKMSDTEFITYADYLASPYYRAYVNARVRTQANAMAAQAKRPSPAPAQAPANRPVESLPKNRREKKRTVFLVLILLLTVITLLLAATYFINVDVLLKYTSVYTVPEGKQVEIVNEETNEKTIEKVAVSVAMADPAIGMVKNFVEMDMESQYFDRYIDGKVDKAGVMTQIAVYAVPVAIAVIVICAIIAFFKSLAALFAGRKPDGYYKKIGFGFLAILMFLCGLIVAVGGLYVSGIGFDGVVEFLTFKATSLQAGYGLYALIALPILIFIFSCASYKKIKR